MGPEEVRIHKTFQMIEPHQDLISLVGQKILLKIKNNFREAVENEERVVVEAEDKDANINL